MRPAVAKSDRNFFAKVLSASSKKRNTLGRAFVVVDKVNRVHGYAGLWFELKGPLSLARGGLDYCFSKKLQGRGIGARIYFRMLDALREAGIPRFSGHTSNPAVKRMAEITKRRPVMVTLTR